MNEDGSWTAVWQNQHVDNNLSPRWPETVSQRIRACTAYACLLLRSCAPSLHGGQWVKFGADFVTAAVREGLC
jgi:hypothetical protein